MAKAAAAAKKPLTKTQIFANVAEETGLSKKQVADVYDALVGQISASLSKKGPRVFTLPGLCKIVVQHKPKQGPRPVRNPATGEMVMSKPKPARDVVKVRALKGLKDMV
ncbi:MAG: HU family DNA-binding protein [Pirellulaceae bacterium]|jgi:nucleoid DNA-binding protein|nr:HU family DNA-binding protein [Pirellulaceae bacterium]